MPPLLEIQRALAASLTGQAAPPSPFDAEQVIAAARSLVYKRRRAAGHLLAETRRALGEGWAPSFEAHARAYVPTGLLYHVDDAWEFARIQSRNADAGIREAARADLRRLGRRYRRSSRRGPYRVQPRPTWARKASRLFSLLVSPFRRRSGG